MHSASLTIKHPMGDWKLLLGSSDTVTLYDPSGKAWVINEHDFYGMFQQFIGRKSVELLPRLCRDSGVMWDEKWGCGWG